ncbi:hypothetical protein PCASD_24865 [Puccinia coronata f. sp. avenae]|uniref:Mob1/phocein n=1 Tax=Puccinia coronata f. sp. avenae TaxID=200324 RepID=A0A2N5TH55_9BASI|nr:hypothetical protein PCASD_24865 [Puccinia coronata f. sp. avenae]
MASSLEPVYLSSPTTASQPAQPPFKPQPAPATASTSPSAAPAPASQELRRTDSDSAKSAAAESDGTSSNSSSPSPSHQQHYPPPIRLRKGTRFEDAYPSMFAALGDKDPDPSSLLASLESPFQLQEYIAHLVRADPHAVSRIIRLPSLHVQREVWIYEQLRRLAHDLGHPLVSALQADCNRSKCPEMKAGEWLYLCAAHATANENECCAIDYIVHTLDGATALLNSARYFPSRLQIPASSIKHFTSIARRLYRILAHAWFHHRELFEECEMETSLYARFLALTDEFGLIAEDLLVIPRAMDDEGPEEEHQHSEPEDAADATEHQADHHQHQHHQHQHHQHHQHQQQDEQQQESLDEEQQDDNKPQEAQAGNPHDPPHHATPPVDIPISELDQDDTRSAQVEQASA